MEVIVDDYEVGRTFVVWFDYMSAGVGSFCILFSSVEEVNSHSSSRF